MRKMVRVDENCAWWKGGEGRERERKREQMEKQTYEEKTKKILAPNTTTRYQLTHKLRTLSIVFSIDSYWYSCRLNPTPSSNLFVCHLQVQCEGSPWSRILCWEREVWVVGGGRERGKRREPHPHDEDGGADKGDTKDQQGTRIHRVCLWSTEGRSSWGRQGNGKVKGRLPPEICSFRCVPIVLSSVYHLLSCTFLVKVVSHSVKYRKFM